MLTISKRNALLLIGVTCVVIAGCETAPTKSDAAASQTVVENDDRCTVTGSRIPKANCRDAGVRSTTPEGWERSVVDRPTSPAAAPGGR
jgi:hypothetical protein